MDDGRMNGRMDDGERENSPLRPVLSVMWEKLIGREVEMEAESAD